MSVTMAKIPLTAQTLYQEMLQLCMAGSGPTGSLYEREIKGGSYLYLKAKAGKFRQDFYLGPVGNNLVEAARQKIVEANELLPARKQLVQMLRKAGLRGPHAEFANVIGALKWNGVMDHCVLVGTQAYACYPALVGERLDDGAMGTQDADIATLNLAIEPGHMNKDNGLSLEDILKLADESFRPIPGLNRKSSPSQFRSKSGFRIDLLTQTRRRGEPEALPLPALKAGAAPLQHLEWLIENPATAVLLAGPGYLVHVPQPSRFAIHKLIIAQKRNTTQRIKRKKDLVQAKSLIAALRESDPQSLTDAFQQACNKGVRGWAEPIRASLKELGISQISD
jgi:hypothetical protein